MKDIVILKRFFKCFVFFSWRCGKKYWQRSKKSMSLSSALEKSKVDGVLCWISCHVQQCWVLLLEWRPTCWPETQTKKANTQENSSIDLLEMWVISEKPTVIYHPSLLWIPEKTACEPLLLQPPKTCRSAAQVLNILRMLQAVAFSVAITGMLLDFKLKNDWVWITLDLGCTRILLHVSGDQPNLRSAWYIEFLPTSTRGMLMAAYSVGWPIGRAIVIWTAAWVKDSGPKSAGNANVMTRM